MSHTSKIYRYTNFDSERYATTDDRFTYTTSLDKWYLNCHKVTDFLEDPIVRQATCGVGPGVLRTVLSLLQRRRCPGAGDASTSLEDTIVTLVEQRLARDEERKNPSQLAFTLWLAAWIDQEMVYIPPPTDKNPVIWGFFAQEEHNGKLSSFLVNHELAQDKQEVRLDLDNFTREDSAIFQPKRLWLRNGPLLSPFAPSSLDGNSVKHRDTCPCSRYLTVLSSASAIFEKTVTPLRYDKEVSLENSLW
ncbi:hypothetical protein LTR70_010632 [Exophiala xenobiotica]|uniref:Uncharacterized protein n=1 Tax=Lithohypha guttulata TaxID=1690604 RepID=A0ABR0JTU1_9EURO|nr:hypothetical protein LTR24_010470 [Lithohypha guttulata]KAK5309071.1 hypothetical protein LTR70_010632 [Exophiala xenobiotica]